MGFEARQRIISRLQELRNTKIVAHINSDRRVPPGQPPLPALQTKLATEAQPFFYEVLQELGKHPQLDLFLYTSGGQTDSVWPLVSLFNEFGEKFNVLVPYKAHSAGTLICLGADTIVMGEAGELSPVDPQTGNQFNPIDDINPKSRRAISVEDVSSYIDFARNPEKGAERSGDEPCRVDINLAFRILAEQVHPLAIGGVNRSHKQIRELTRRLLALRHVAEPDRENGRLDEIVNTLTEGRYSHSDILNRREAQQLIGKDFVRFPDDEEQELMWNLFEEYAETISLRKAFVLQNEVGNQQQAEIEIVGAFIETERTSYIFRALSQVTQRSVLPSGYQINIQPGTLMPLIPGFPREMHVDLLEIGWFENREGI